MKRSRKVLCLAVVAAFPSIRNSGADARPGDAAGPAGAPTFYPWSETSDYARVPKSFLGQLSFLSVGMTNTETRQLIITDEFIKTFKLTPSESERMTTALADALHQYRTAESKHLEPTTEEVNVGPPQRRGPAAVEKFSFRLVPFPEEAQAIRRKLEEAVLATLGEERSKLFWQYPSIMESEMKTFARESPVPAGMVRTTTFTFQLTDADPGPLVDLYKSTMTRRVDGRPGGGGGTSGSTYGAPLDQYAPEAMKPVLVRWRKAIADGTVRKKAEASPDGPRAGEPAGKVLPGIPEAKETPTAKSSTSQTRPLPPESAKWDDRSPFVDLPKSLIKSLRLPGLTAENEISPEAMSLFGLTLDEAKAVRALYEEMKTRFENLERAHFERSKDDKNRFVLRAFPEKNAVLQKEWTERLQVLVGAQRGELLDHSVRTPASPFNMMRRGGPRGGIADRRGFSDNGPDWLHRGEAEFQINVSPGNPGRDGQPTLRIEYESHDQGGARGSWGGRRDQIPERWRHLLTPDILGLPLTL